MALALYHARIVSTIKKEYPNVIKLLTDPDSKYETLAVLKAAEAITGYSIEISEYSINHKGSNNLITWSEYGTKLEEHLKNNNKYKLYPHLLEKAVKSLAKYFHNEHYKKYPYWPSSGKSNPSGSDEWHKIDVDQYDDYVHKDFYVAYAAEGWIKVRDERPSSNQYIAKFKAQPKISLLKCNRVKLRMLEDAAKNKGIEWAKKDIKKTYQQRNLIALTWKSDEWTSAALFD